MYFRAGRKSAQDVSLSDYIDTGTDGAPLALMDVVSEDADLMEQVANRETVEQMALGAMERLKTECALATSGIAGPGGGTADKPVGTIWIALAYKNEIHTQKLEGDFGREQNVQRTIEMALKMLCERLKG